MATDVGSAIAQGLESGFGRGLRADEAAMRKRAETRAIEEASARGAREDRAERRKGVMENIDLLERQQKMIVGRRGELEALSTAAQTAGESVDPVLSEEYGELGEQLTGLRQRALDYFSRAATGQLDPLQSSPAELYTNTIAATGRPLKELRKVPKYIADVQAGLQTNNIGLLVQGANGLFAPELRRGVGTESPYGGIITRKEIIGMDPAVDNERAPLPGKFMLRLRVYVAHPAAGGRDIYYDAPMTEDGSAEGGAHVAIIDVENSMDWMGNLGTLAAAIQRPDVAAKLDAGEKEVGPKLKAHLDSLTVIGRPKAKGAPAERLELIERHAKKNNLSLEDAAKQLQSMGVLAGLGALGQKTAEIDKLNVSEDEKTRLKRDVTLGAGGKTTGLIPQKVAGKAAGGSTGVSGALGGAVAPDGAGNAAVDFWARAVIAGDREWQIGLGRSKSGAELIEKVKRRVPALATEMGLTPQDMGTTRAQQAALGATLKELTKRSAAVELFASKVEKDMGTLDAELKSAGSGPLALNKPINYLRREFTSDGAIQRLDLAAKQVGVEYERLIGGGALSVAQLHAGALEDAKKLINGDMTPKQARAVMALMRTEMGNARTAAREAEDRIATQLRGLGGARAPGTPLTSAPGQVQAPGRTPPAGALKEGQVTTFRNGTRWTLQNGQPVEVK
jgi:hypothetical protein